MRSNFSVVCVGLLMFVGSACAHRPHDENLIVVKHERNRGWLGVSIEDVTSKFARQKDLKIDEGVYVTSIQDESPAETAGIKEGDVIVEFEGRKIFNGDDLMDEVRRTKPGTEVQIGINRNGETKNLKATLGKMPHEPRAYSFTIPHPPSPRIRVAPHISFRNEAVLYGLTVEELNPQLGEYFGAADGNGVFVKNVKRNSEAAKAGFKAGDVIVKVGKNEVVDVEDIWQALDDYKKGESAEFEILRKGVKHTLSLPIDERERGLSIRRFRLDGDDDVVIDLEPLENGKLFRREAGKLRRELERLQDELHDSMIDWKHHFKKKIDNVRDGVNV